MQAWPKAVPEQAQVQERRDEGPVGVPHPRHQPHQGHRGERERERERRITKCRYPYIMKYFTLVNFSLEYDNFLGYAKYLVPTDGLPEYVLSML